MSLDAMSAARTMCEALKWRVTNLMLQKLLYISEMIWLGRSDGKESLLHSDFEAWDYGPVQVDVYHRAKAFGDKALPDVFQISDIWDGERGTFVCDIAEHFGSYSPFELVEYTHWPSGAWANTYIPGVQGIVIPRDEIVKEYRERVRIISGTGSEAA